MTDTTLYAGLVGQKLHGTIRTNGLAYGGAMKSSKKIVVLGRIAFFVALLIAFFCFAAEAFVAGGVVIAATIVALTVLARVFGLSDRTEDAAGSNVPPRLESDRIWQDYYNSASPLYICRDK